MTYYLYILRSLKDTNLYVGHTQDLKSRIKTHNQGKVRSTKNRRPFKLVHFEEYNTQDEAIKRERFLKSLKGAEFKKRFR